MSQEFSEEYMQDGDLPKPTRLTRRTIHVKGKKTPVLVGGSGVTETEEVLTDIGRAEIEQAKELERVATRVLRSLTMEDMAWAHLVAADARCAAATLKGDGDDAYTESEFVMEWMEKYDALVNPQPTIIVKKISGDDDSDD
jgi:hypothetical protein